MKGDDLFRVKGGNSKKKSRKQKSLGEVRWKGVTKNRFGKSECNAQKEESVLVNGDIVH